MQYQQRNTPQRQQRRTRRGLQNEFTPSVLVTALSIGAVILIVAITFIADWMKVPAVNLSAPNQVFSPNGDGNYDLFTMNYRLDDNSNVTVRVYSGLNAIRTLADAQSQTAGEHFLSWDGLSDQGTVAADGAYRVEISAGGALRSAAQSVTVQVDTQPPAVQLANLTDGMQVNKASMTLEGVTEPGAVVLLAGSSQPLRVDNTGRFSFPYKLNDGDNRVEIQVSDAAGNTSTVQRSISLVTQPPDIELTRPLDNEWTNKQLLNIEGVTRPGATLTINQQNVKVDTDGHFQHQFILNDGDNALRLVVTDSVGNIATLDRIVHLKVGASTIQVNVEDGATLADPNLQLTGKVEPGSQVTVNGKIVPVGVLGDFQVSTPLNTGDNTIDIQSTDQAGNISRLTRHVTYSSGGTDGFARLSSNLDQMPLLIIPSALLIAGILAFIYLRQNRVTLALGVDQPIFSPGGFGDDNVLGITLDLSKTARVSLEVLDQQGNPRATILFNRRKMGRRHVFYWNGYDDRGMPLPPGDYTLQAEAGAPPLQVTSAVQIRIERRSVMQVQSPTYVTGGTTQK